MASIEKELEIELARELLEGGLGAFDRFAEAFHSRLFNYTMMVCGRREDAEEVAQDTLLSVFRNFGQLRDPEHVRAWVFRIARNACLMKRRKSVFAPDQEISLDDLIPVAGGQSGSSKMDIADWSALPDQQVLEAELRDILQEAIRGLPDIYRNVILLRDVEDLTTEETAGVLEISRDAVKARLHRARLAVRQKLDSYLRSRVN
jgi:RNA polymerase sigma-70 factor (ECF subfamily)